LLEHSLTIIDNVLPEDLVVKWKDFYVNTTFRRSATENDEGPVYFCRDIQYKELIEIFDYENTIVPNAQKIDSRVTDKVHRSYVNVFDSGDTFEGHKDVWQIPEDKYAVSCVLFLNPEWEDAGGGLEFTHNDQSVMVDNVFNRLVVFNGNVHHCVQPYQGNKARITLYTQFNNVIPNLPKLASHNKW
tara:strand:+ start:63 stop:623 length:561 start_codon:yes stop_codon:yes gene_type:complete